MTSATGIGARVLRTEDKRFLTGTGRYVDDLPLARATYAYFLRSPHAHAKIKSIDISAAEKHPGVVNIFTGKDLVDAKVGGLICGWVVKDRLALSSIPGRNAPSSRASSPNGSAWAKCWGG